MGKSTPAGGGATRTAMIVVPGATLCMAVNRSPEIIGHADALRGHMEISFELPRVPDRRSPGGRLFPRRLIPDELANSSRPPAASLVHNHPLRRVDARPA